MHYEQMHCNLSQLTQKLNLYVHARDGRLISAGYLSKCIYFSHINTCFGIGFCLILIKFGFTVHIKWNISGK